MLNRMVKAIHEELEKVHDLDIVFTVLYGSQNYGLETDKSDVDVQAYVTPKFHDLYDGRMINKVYQTKYGEATVKDIREFEKLIYKANPTTLEVMFTEYRYAPGFDLDLLFEDKEVLALGNTYNFLQATLGTTIGKHKRLARDGKIDVKEYVHFMRLCTLLEDILVDGRSFERSLKYGSTKSTLQKYRNTAHHIEAAAGEVFDKYLDAADKLLASTKALVNEVLESKDRRYSEETYDEALQKLKAKLKSVVVNKLRKELTV